MWGDNFIIDLREIRWKGVSLICLAWDRDWWKMFMNMERKLWVPCNVRNFSKTVLEHSLFRRHQEHKQKPVQYQYLLCVPVFKFYEIEFLVSNN